MFEYPTQAEVNRAIPKSKIYSFAKTDRAMRGRFVSQVREIVWKYKLAPETVNLAAAGGVQEIQVFGVGLKTGDLSSAGVRSLVLAIDKAIPSPVFYELAFGDQVKFVATWKRPSEADSNKVVVEGIFPLPWQPAATSRTALPVALDLSGLYEQMLRRHLWVRAEPMVPRPGETLAEQVQRLGEIQTAEADCRKLEVRMSKEQQFKRKVEINSSLRQRRAELERALVAGTHTPNITLA